MKRTIAIVAGGDSSEHGVSMKSAEGIYSFIDQDKYTLYIVELTKARWEAILSDGSRAQVDKNDFSFMDHGQKIIPDFAYITIHGTPGENGILQGYFELLGIPYSTCDVLVSALTFSKFTLNQAGKQTSRYQRRRCHRKNRLALLHQAQCQRFQLRCDKGENKGTDSAGFGSCFQGVG